MSQHINVHDFDFAGGIEDTFIPQGRPGLRPLEEYELTQHYEQWREDLDRAASLGITRLRWGVPWYRVEPEPGMFDWSWVDRVLDYMINTLHIQPIVDLVHYGTPLWLAGSFVDPAYSERVELYARAFAQRYGKMVRYYTALNEPTVNSDFSGRSAQWPPYLCGNDGYVRVMLGIARGMQRTISAVRELDADAVFVAVEAMHLYRALSKAAQEAAKLAFHQDLLCWDLVRGAVDEAHPLWGWLRENGAADDVLAELRACAVKQDIFGVNFYPWSSTDFIADNTGTVHGANGPDSGRYLADVLRQVYGYVRKPLFVTETSSPGDYDRRALWMSETLDAVKTVRAEGVPVVGYTWFPIITMIGWEYRGDQKPVADHLLHLGLWDASYDDTGKLVRHETPLVAGYRDWVSRAMPEVGCRPSRCHCVSDFFRRLWRRVFPTRG